MSGSCAFFALALLSSLTHAQLVGRNREVERAHLAQAEAIGRQYQQMFAGRSFIPDKSNAGYAEQAPYPNTPGYAPQVPFSNTPTSFLLESQQGSFTSIDSEEKAKANIGPSQRDLLYKKGCAPVTELGNGQEDRPFMRGDGLEDYDKADKWSDADFDAYADTFKAKLTPYHLQQFRWEVCDLRQRSQLGMMMQEQNGLKAMEDTNIEYNRKIMRVMETFKKAAAEDSNNQVRRTGLSSAGLVLPADYLAATGHQVLGSSSLTGASAGLSATGATQGQRLANELSAAASPQQHWTLLDDIKLHLPVSVALFSLFAFVWRRKQAQQPIQLGPSLEDGAPSLLS